MNESEFEATKDFLSLCKRDLTQEQILWRKYEKGIQYDNIIILKRKIKELEDKLDKLRESI